MLFNGSKLHLARRRRGHSIAELASKCGISSRMISKYEGGHAAPSAETLRALAAALSFPEAFFFGGPLEEPNLAGVSFRSMTAMTAWQRDAALASAAIGISLCRHLEAKFTLPSLDLPDLRLCDPEAAAEAMRAQWGIGEKPIKNLVHLLESKGVRVFSLAEETRSIDAFSFWMQQTPFVFLNTEKSTERSRFDGAHELGHLVMHRHGAPVGPTAEQDANRFASAFLMPRAGILAVAPRLPRLDHLMQLRLRWRVSVNAFVRRLHDLKTLSDYHYRRLNIELSEKGLRTQEPVASPRETSLVLGKVFAALRDDGIGKTDLARLLDVHPAEIDAVVFGLAMIVVSGDDTAAITPRAATALRLV